MKEDNKKVIYWLLVGCLLIFIMVVIGGITRLTHSGLSISNYKLISGTIPPMNESEWEQAFDLYKQYPEYQKLNTHFDIEDFKSIYFWEWLHRFIGRFIGIVFFLPFLYFIVRKQLSTPTIKKTIILLCLGAFQGFLGWYMVKSGLVNKPDVSHYRLAAHLITAFITFAYTFWVALDLIFPQKKEVNTNIRKIAQICLLFIIIQIVWGALVAGLDAGFIHNFWPLMSEGTLMHKTVLTEQTPVWKNFIEGRSGVQFTHRYLAYIVVGAILYLWHKARQIDLTHYQKRGIHSVVLIVCIQFILGVLTLIYAVPLWLGIAHQVFAFFLLSAMTFVLHRFSR